MSVPSSPGTGRDIPIIFSGPMVRALLDGRKTMTRRLAWTETLRLRTGVHYRESPWRKVKPGDRLWVREAAAWIHNTEYNDHSYWEYRADTDGKCFAGQWPEDERDNPDRPRWKPAIHMPRPASRLTLNVIASFTERLQQITQQDAAAEGHDPTDSANSPRIWFMTLWDSLHGPGSWDENPEVVAIRFTVQKQNIDAMKDAA